jgi:FtsP/CotA-like multicopper oxidase with cupredoxin domain
MRSKATALRRMSPAKLSVLGFVVLAVATSIFLLAMGPGFAMPGSPTDSTKVPHYFGPWPNWVLSPLTLPDVAVDITGDGSGATATATVGANGTVTDIVVTDPGAGYTSATATITGAGTGAAATAVVTASGVVTGIDVTAAGSGYTRPEVTIAGGGATTDATATAFGGVDAITLTNGGTGYTFPTVDFDMPDDPNGVQASGHIDPATDLSPSGEVQAIHLDDPGSGYASAPAVVIRDGTLQDPINNGASGATATATIKVTSVALDSFGAGYTSAPTVTIAEGSPSGSGTGATATARVDAGGVSSITLGAGGSGYVTGGGIRKFVDGLPGLCDPGVPGSCPSYLTDPGAKYIPLGVPDTSGPYQTAPDVSDTYEIALVQYKTSFSSSLPNTLVRGYVQLETAANAAISQHFPLTNTMLDGTEVPILDGNGHQYLAVTPPQYLGPVIAATKDKPVRIVFRNLLPTGDGGDLFLPVDSTMMGSGMNSMNEPYDPTPTVGGTVMDMVRNPMCTDEKSMGDMCFTKNRATLHLHGGNTPWISDGTPHQWITPAGEMTSYPEGVSVRNVPDMNVCNAADDGCQTFYYTNQQSARLMFYHDHAWGITRLNVYAGEAAGYLISDATEKALIAGGTIPGPADTIPLIVQDKTFVPQDTQLYDTAGSYGQDPTWDKTRWGGYGSLWYHHVYMPAQNPGDPSGMSAYGRWMYGPWFWPPAGDAKYGPIDNPYYDPNCSIDDPATWQYQTDPFCEPQQIPGTPNISAGMEQFNDTPLVNGVAYPTITVQPKSYRLRMLNAANDRFFNFQWYVADATTASTGLNAAGQPVGGTEVALKASEVAAAQTDPAGVFPTPDRALSPAGPNWIQIGTEGGFLPAPAVIDGSQVTTWITDPTRFDVGNVDQHSLVIAPAERADVIVDFSKYAGKTLILYNDAPAAYPARVPSYDYYTGYPDQSPNGPSMILPGYGPNTRTIMQVKVAAAPAAPAFNLTALRNAFSHKANGSGVFESGQHPIVVGQAPYNSAYGQSFAAAGYCTEVSTRKCDGYARINQQGGDKFTFDTLRMKSNGTYPSGYGKVSVKIEPKAIHDEQNASSFDEFGRMQANLGLEVVPATPGLQNIVLHPFTFPTTEIIDTTGLPSADVKVTPIANGNDGTQIWKITHNGVDTHPIHFHAFDVQVLNRVTWDNIIIPPDPNELGWKDTVRMSPLEDTIVAVRPVVPKLPWEVPNSIRELNPEMQDGAPISLSSVAIALGLAPQAFAPNGEPVDIYNHLINYGAEYVYHCHILSHEEMDMMRPVSLAYAPAKPDRVDIGIMRKPRQRLLIVSWYDNSIAETAYVVQQRQAGGWVDVGLVESPLNEPNTSGTRLAWLDPDPWVPGMAYRFRVVALNTVGDTHDYADPNINTIVSGGFPTMTTSSVSDPATLGVPPNTPTSLTATLQSGPRVVLGWQDAATNEIGFIVERAANGGAFVQIATTSGLGGTGAVSYTDTTTEAGNTYSYRVAAYNAAGPSGYTNTATVVIPALPGKPAITSLVASPVGGNESVAVGWTNVVGETSYKIQWSVDSSFAVVAGSGTAGANVTTFTTGSIVRQTWWFRVAASNAAADVWSDPVSVGPAP